jgi:hypothetical protein
MDKRVFGANLIAPRGIAADRGRSLSTAEEDASDVEHIPRDRHFLGIAALVAVVAFGVASANMHGAGSLSVPLAGVGDPFIAGYTEEHPAVPGPYAELPMRHYLAARDPMTGVNLTTRDPPAPIVAPPPLAAISMLPR